MPVKRNFHFYNDPFVSLVTSLIYQQINYKTAVSIEGKFLSHFNYQPTAEQLVCLNDKEFRRFGISAGKAKYIRNVSEFFIQHNGLIKKLITTNDYQKIAELLIEIKGVGDWTIEMFLLFCLRDPHILSVKDLIIMNGLKYILKTDDISPSLLKSFRDSISGIESLVSINIWQFIEGGYINAREVI